MIRSPTEEPFPMIKWFYLFDRENNQWIAQTLVMLTQQY